jgi:RNA polymerase sigma-70 factor (ECF subfamily)
MMQNNAMRTAEIVPLFGGRSKTRREKQASYKSRGVSAPGRLRAASRASSDEELLRSIGERDQGAMEVLFTRHSVRVFRFASSITNSPALAEDVVSDVFFDVWRRPGSFKGKCQVSTWLLAIARHKALSALQRRVHESLTEQLEETIEAPTDGPEVVIERKQIGALLGDCLPKLSVIHREIVDLVYYHEKSIEEVAEILQIPTGTVKTRMFNTRKSLAGMLAGKAAGHFCSDVSSAGTCSRQRDIIAVSDQPGMAQRGDAAAT